jgi:hypothetical protein
MILIAAAISLGIIVIAAWAGYEASKAWNSCEEEDDYEA